jgi:hypothetical protein
MLARETGEALLPAVELIPGATFDPRRVELDREGLPGTTLFSVGVTVDPDGSVYVPTFDGLLFAYRPAAAGDG